MQVAPKAIGNFPNIPSYPAKKASNPSRRPLPQSKTRHQTAATAMCKLLMAITIAATPFAVGNVAVKVMATENGYHIQRLQDDIIAQRSVSEETRLTNAKLSSLERIKSIAKSKFAMTDPAGEVTIISMPGAGVTSPEYASLTTKEAQ